MSDKAVLQVGTEASGGQLGSLTPHGLFSLDPDAKNPVEHSQHLIVQFYEDEDILYDNVSRFLAAGLQEDEPAIVIATQGHCEALLTRLAQLDVDVERARSTGQLSVIDAREALVQFMVGDSPDWQKFSDYLAGVIHRSLDGRSARRVRAWGEMVDLLWRDGNRQGAVRVEEYWNDLATRYPASILCAYVMANFYKIADAEQALGNSAAPLAHNGNSERPRDEISKLEQRARTLETENAYRKDLEVALREALSREKALREQAERHVRLSEMFADMLGHDLRNPLGTITMGANYLARANAGDKVTRTASRIANSADRMSRMIDQLLDFTRIRAGNGIDLELKRTDLGELIARVKTEMETTHPQTTVDVQSSGDLVGQWDGERVLQVLSNLIGNAISHCGAPPGQDKPCRVGARIDGSQPAAVVVEIHNDSVIPPEVLPVIFEPIRAGAKRANSKGLGLGLYITRQIVLAHAGSVEVSSREGAGTTVTITLPRSPPSATADQP
ncbi:MAG: MEDS domain-containing protein [Kofleriaceae bacterium]